MQYGLHFPNFGAFDARTLAEIAQEAENVGWDGIFVWDHINRTYQVPVYDPWISLAAVAMTTERVHIGTMVTPLARRRPQKVARECITLDKLSNGRFILGVGIGSSGGGEVEWSHFGEEMNLKTRAQMTDETLEILTGLWSGVPFAYKGEHYEIQESQFLPSPVNERIPVWVAGYYPSKPPIRRAARWDGAFLFYNEADDVPAAIRDARAYIQSQRVRDTPLDMVYVNQESPEHDAQGRIAAVGDAGITWWFEEIVPQRFGADWEGEWPLAKMREFIQQGPPKI